MADPNQPGSDSKFVDDDESNVTPEEQAEYDRFMENALTLMYDESGAKPELIQALGAAKDGEAQEANPAILALAQTAVTIVGQLDDSAREAGKPVSDDVLYHGSFAVVQELAELAEAAKIHDYSEEDITGAFMQAIDIYRPKLIESGRTTEEELKAGFAQINEADQQGRMGELLPGLDSPQGAPDGQ